MIIIHRSDAARFNDMSKDSPEIRFAMAFRSLVYMGIIGLIIGSAAAVFVSTLFGGILIVLSIILMLITGVSKVFLRL